MSEIKQEKIQIPYPPDYIFKYRKNIRAPAGSVMEQENATFVFKNIEYKYGEGIFAYFEGVPYPAKGHPFPEAIYALNMVKRLFIDLARIISSKEGLSLLIGLLFLSKKKKIKFIELILWCLKDISDTNLIPYYLEDGYYSSAPKELIKFLKIAFISWGISNEIASLFAEILAIFIQNDNAYYFRFIDIMSETTKEKLIKSPRRELKRLIKIANSRERVENTGQKDKNKALFKILSLLLFIPSVKKAFRTGLEAIDFSKWQYDEADKYHVLLWADYKFMGKSIEQRIEEFKEIHKNGFPPRIVFKPQ